MLPTCSVALYLRTVLHHCFLHPVMLLSALWTAYLLSPSLLHRLSKSPHFHCFLLCSHLCLFQNPQHSRFLPYPRKLLPAAVPALPASVHHFPHKPQPVHSPVSSNRPALTQVTSCTSGFSYFSPLIKPLRMTSFITRTNCNYFPLYSFYLSYLAFFQKSIGFFYKFFIFFISLAFFCTVHDSFHAQLLSRTIKFP